MNENGEAEEQCKQQKVIYFLNGLSIKSINYNIITLSKTSIHFKNN